MKLKVNDQEVETGAINLLELSQELELPSAGVAVAVNQRMIPRTEWKVFTSNDGDNILIITADCGG